MTKLDAVERDGVWLTDLRPYGGKALADGTTRKWDLAVVAAAVAVIGIRPSMCSHRYFPPITLWTGLSLLAVAAVEAGWAVSVRGRIREGPDRSRAGRPSSPWWRRALPVAKASGLGGSRDAVGLVGRRVRIPVLASGTCSGGGFDSRVRLSPLSCSGPRRRGAVAGVQLQVPEDPSAAEDAHADWDVAGCPPFVEAGNRLSRGTVTP